MADWLFQGNPAHYPVQAALDSFSTIQWTVSRYAAQMGIGDRVYFWESKPTRGVVAAGRLVSEPTPEVATPGDELFFADPADAAAEETRVWIELSWRLATPI